MMIHSDASGFKILRFFLPGEERTKDVMMWMKTCGSMQKTGLTSVVVFKYL